MEPLSAGRFLHTNLFADGSVPAVASALGETISGLAAVGRMHVDEIPRRHFFSRIQPYAATVY